MSMRETANLSKAWVFEEARKVVSRAEKLGRDEVIFETGYGPSGLPHIGTFGEVAHHNDAPNLTYWRRRRKAA